jgi:aspartate aminotransferase/aromatic-amino-acid transaminase
MFEHLTPAPPDAILGLTEAFKKDPNPNKINLGVGVYLDDSGVTPVMHCVKEAEQRLAAEETSKSYLPMTGSPSYGRLVQELMFGEQHAVIASGQVKTAQTPGGTGGLRVGADTARKFAPEAKVWMSAPTWANHRGIFEAAGFEAAEYPYYDPSNKQIRWEAMRKALMAVPAGDLVLLHVCCHNPTGVDLTDEQWRQVALLAATGGWIPFFDFAYQGLADGLAKDASPLEHFLYADLELFIASSFSKNFGLYCERTGALTLVARTSEAAEAALSHLKLVIRRNYSNPPSHGAAIVEKVLGEPSLRSLWQQELTAMRERIKQMRTALVQGLKQRGVQQDFSFIERQRGMFSFSGLSEVHVNRLREERSIYIVKGGRINVAGITSKNVDYLCDAMAEVLK